MNTTAFKTLECGEIISTVLQVQTSKATVSIFMYFNFKFSNTHVLMHGPSDARRFASDKCMWRPKTFNMFELQ